MSDDSHRALKRWEKARQWAAVKGDPELAGPPAWCRVKPVSKDGEPRVPVHIVHLYSGDLTCVKAYGESAPEGLSGSYWLVRGGIRWEDYLRGIVRHYALGRPVPAPFRPVRKIGSEIIDHLGTLPDTALPPVFEKMRETGLLPRLEILSRENCPQALAWDTIRASFQDFLGLDA